MSPSYKLHVSPNALLIFPNHLKSHSPLLDLRKQAVVLGWVQGLCASDLGPAVVLVWFFFAHLPSLCRVSVCI